MNTRAPSRWASFRDLSLVRMKREELDLAHQRCHVHLRATTMLGVNASHVCSRTLLGQVTDSHGPALPPTSRRKRGFPRRRAVRHGEARQPLLQPDEIRSRPLRRPQSPSSGVGNPLPGKNVGASAVDRASSGAVLATRFAIWRSRPSACSLAAHSSPQCSPRADPARVVAPLTRLAISFQCARE